jgi:RsiW-degrading membrane proteinase PrsW (M82 family)
MSSEQTGDGPSDAVPMTECRVCQVDVPDGEFCGLCGVRLTAQPGDGPDWLRPKVFGAAPSEHLLTPEVASSLFPQLPPRAVRTFRVALLVMVAALVAFAVLRMPGCLVAVAALGFPMLFLLYLYESDANDDLPIGDLILTAVLGIVLGVTWVLLTGAMVARSYGVPLGGGVAASRVLGAGLGVSIGNALLLLAPAVMVRLLRPSPNRESLDGFMIGALGALAFTAAATITRLAPQLATGLVSRSRPMVGMLVEGGIRGLAVPITAAAAGGLIGAALWFRRPANKEHQHVRAARVILGLLGLGLAAIYLMLGLVDTTGMPEWVMLACHLAVALVAVVLLRIGLQLALLHEVHDEIQSDQPLLCPYCGHVVPDMAFCPACGAATRATSRSSRRARRQHRPVRTDAEGGHQ